MVRDPGKSVAIRTGADARQSSLAVWRRTSRSVDAREPPPRHAGACSTTALQHDARLGRMAGCAKGSGSTRFPAAVRPADAGTDTDGQRPHRALEQAGTMETMAAWQPQRMEQLVVIPKL